MTTAARPGTCQRAQADLGTAVRTLTRTYLAAAQARMAAATRPACREYDLVNGLTGPGAYLLRQQPDSALMHEVLTYLVALTAPVAAADPAGTDAPGWWTADIPAGKPPERFHGGHADLGMAHGIAVISCVKSFTQVGAVSCVEAREGRWPCLYIQVGTVALRLVFRAWLDDRCFPRMSTWPRWRASGWRRLRSSGTGRAGCCW
jgi:hypothetical protein